MIKREDVYKIGRLGKPHGVKGEIAFHFTDDVFDRVDADYLVMDMDGILVPFFMEEYRFRSDETALITFEGVTTQEQAKALTGTDVFFPRALADADEEHVSWASIIGFEIVDKATGGIVGKLTAVDQSTVNTLFEVEQPNGNQLLLPAHEKLIHDADTQEKKIYITIPQGLLDL